MTFREKVKDFQINSAYYSCKNETCITFDSFVDNNDDAILYYFNENVNIKGINIYVYTDKEKKIVKRIVSL